MTRSVFTSENSTALNSNRFNTLPVISAQEARGLLHSIAAGMAEAGADERLAQMRFVLAG